MAEMTELVFIPFPSMGHILPTIQMAQNLITQQQSDRSSSSISVTILIIPKLLPTSIDKIDSYLQSIKSQNNPLITLLEIPPLETDVLPTSSSKFLSSHLDSYKPVVKQALSHHYYNNSASSSAPRLGGLVLDFFWTSMIEVGDDLHIPSYIFFTSGATFLTAMFHFESLRVNIPATFGGAGGSLDDETVAVHLSGFQNPLPVKYWPSVLLDKDGPGRSEMLLGHARRFRRAKGILVNTFMELEHSIIRSMDNNHTRVGGGGDGGDEYADDDDHIPPIYPVGPILNMESNSSSNSNEEVDVIMRWLDTQPPSSVVFLCFGSMGSFDEDQVKQIAIGLEQSGHRFLWSLRRPPYHHHHTSSTTNNKGTKVVPVPGEYDDFTPVLPAGFLDRTAEIGKVIGWAPQVAVLAHKAVGAFVSHCGWNSTLESLWFGVPMLTWPMYAEQQLNAFLLVKELGLAVDIRMDYACNPREGGANMVVMAEEVEMGIRRMMEQDDGLKVRRKVKEMSEAARKAVSRDGDGDGDGDVGGSSWVSMSRFVEDVIAKSSKV